MRKQVKKKRERKGKFYLKSKQVMATPGDQYKIFPWLWDFTVLWNP